ncbi:MAG: 30S ribosomal protein S20 [Sulfuricurvum sp. PD_MW2]|uniref:30S ribosomal protein S20 n=1 Tax=Sulfuricurvum sp. PD_MW2 TaxID=2027917 RepID=UPI000C06128D|nr:30S ribosomal protein S20 [Sulfuricurvum sp. PD_MW2]PHM18568.1 MAG: 30S ribosomal protein S20 [Sulfuricurvum sp. PD_MW2]
MANHKSALKRIRQTEKRTERNRFYRTRIKNIVKAVRSAVEAGNKDAAKAALVIANANLHKYVSKGVLKKETAARKVSRLHLAVNKMAA